MSENNTISAWAAYQEERNRGPVKAEEKTKPKMTSEEIKKKYFTPKDDETQFRVLPPKEEGGLPFEEVYFHDIYVNGSSKKMPCLHHYDGTPCPICNHSKELKAKSNDKETYPEKTDRDAFFKSSKFYEARKFYVFKGIDRNHEGDGVKFWRIKDNYKKDGIFDMIEPIVSRFHNKKGVDFTNIENGIDFVITTKDAEIPNTKRTYRKITSIQASDQEILHRKPEKVNDWINDTLTWRDVYRPINIYNQMNPTEYMEAVLEDKAPVWDDKNKTWLFKDDQGGLYRREPNNQQQGGASSTVSTGSNTTSNVADISGAIDMSSDTGDDLPF
jgi:hypothetical protein